MSKVGTRTSPGSYCALPAAQYVRRSWSTPLGARSTGGVCFEPIGSVAQVASAHCSNQSDGMRSAFLFSPTPVNQRCLAESFVTVRYAPNGPSPPMIGRVVKIHSCAYSTRPLTFEFSLALYMLILAIAHDRPIRFNVATPRFCRMCI